MKRLLLILTVALQALWTTAAAQTSSWSDNRERNWASDYDSQTSFTINSAQDFAQFAWMVNNDSKDFRGKTVTLATDLELGAHLWEPIGYCRSNTDYTYFRGTFDGGGKTIRGLVIDKSTVANNPNGDWTAGLFGYLMSPVSIKNLIIETPVVKGAVLSGTGDSPYTGALAGRIYDADGSITNCHVTGGGTITGGTNSGALSYTGGLIGYAYGISSLTITRCSNSAAVTAGEGSSFHTGGLVGNLAERTTLSNCFNSGAVTGGKATGNSFTGGLVGDGSGTSIISITNCYNTGTVTGGEAGTGYSQTGGIIGNGIKVENCYNSGTVRGARTTGSGTSSTGGIAGRGSGGSNITNCFVACPSVTAPEGDINRIIGTNNGTLSYNYAYVPQGTWANPLLAHDNENGADWTAPAATALWSASGAPTTSWTFGSWDATTNIGAAWLDESVGDYLPILNGFPDGVEQPRVQFRFSGGGDGSEPTPFLIKNRADMDYLSAQVNGGATYDGKYFRLAPEGGDVLDMGNTHFEPIGNQRSNTDRNPFRGTFDGNGCTIKGLVIDKKANPGNGDNCAALFGYVTGNTNSIRNLILEAPQMTGADASDSYTGALAGYINGLTTLSGCHTTAGNGSGFVRGGEATSDASYTGGLAGFGNSITNSSNAIAITGGDATVDSWTGGLAGFATDLDNCFNSATVRGADGGLTSRTGGLAGSNRYITNCYNTGAVTGGSGANFSHTGGITGYSQQITTCYNTGSVVGIGTGADAYTGGIAGNLAPNLQPSSHNLALPPSLTGAAATYRIAGLKDSGATLSGNYAYVPQGTWDNPAPAPDGLNGADWDPSAPAATALWSDAGAPFTGNWSFGAANSGASWLDAEVGNYLPQLNGIPDGVPQPRVQFRFSGGDGSEQTPFLIKNRADMDYLSAQVAAGETYDGKYFRLDPEGGGKVLDMGGTHFEPIGNQRSTTDYNSFRGTFDGNGCTIKGLVIDKKANPGNGDICAALFGYVTGNTNSIRNLILEAPQVTGADASYSYTGALVGYINGSTAISDCHTTAGNGGGFVRGGEATPDASYTGGLAGNTAFDITNSSNAIAITGGNAPIDSYTGGLAGFASKLDNCFNTATVQGGNESNSRTGGLAGSNRYITNCYNTGSVTGGSGTNNSLTGGIAGYSRQITTCYNAGSVVGTGTGANANTGGIAGYLTQNLQPSSHNLALPPSLAGDAATYRIAGHLDGGVTLSGNYAYVPQGTWDNPAPAHNNENGADWDGLMTSAPILQGGTGGWSNTDWTIDNTHQLMPKLQGITIPQPDVTNPFATKSITATFDTQGGSTIDAQTLGLGGNITEPATPPARQYYTFAGWHADAAGTTAFDFGYIVSGLSADTTIYAHWTRDRHTLTLPYPANPAGSYELLDKNGDIIARTDTIIDAGEAFEFRIKLAEGYSNNDLKVFNDLKVLNDLKDFAEGFSFKTDPIAASGDITVSPVPLALNQYTVMLPRVAGVHYLVDEGLMQYLRADREIDEGTFVVPHGVVFRFAIRLLEGYTEADATVRANGAEVLPDGGGYYNITANANILVTIGDVKLNKLTVTLPDLEGITYATYDGSPLAAGQHTVSYFSTFTFQVIAGEQYSNSTLTITTSSGTPVTVIDLDRGIYQVSVRADADILIAGLAANTFIVRLPFISGITLNPSAGYHVASVLQDFIFTLTLDDDYAASTPKVEIDGQELPALSINGLAYTYALAPQPPEGGGAIEVVITGITKVPTGSLPNPSQGGAKVWTIPNHVVVEAGSSTQEAGSGTLIRVYTAAGRLALQQALVDDVTRIRLDKGIYIVAVGNKAFKVVVRE